ncbi:hypothetical protein K8Z61_17685 [Nocardioides sp. TRM66260-LWL]|uniref:hypothetical protein n=1 Tax=Nocardioides sp. TRM66260-LWL TaxID=2874478 RepID=UPI001CC77982|nr:hypothetical protein [Nocardioides sp. TRM66260-LWL]MBZ5736326.1 hypothetical protein [Nocardioides sp. TRM66260-LWL]
MSLSEDLERLAEGMPPPALDPTTWRRARRARLRDRVLAAVAVVALLAGTVGLVDVLRPPVPPEVADGGGALDPTPGLPSRLVGPPSSVVDGPAGASGPGWEVTDHLDVGVAAAAWLADFGSGRIVLVGAADGRYRLVEPPGFVGSAWGPGTLQQAGLALSPDGERLAYAWLSFRGAPGPDTPTVGGVRVLDLRTGRVRSHRIDAGGALGVAVRALAWSPDGRRVGWLGQRFDAWTRSGMGPTVAVAGGIGVLGRDDLDAVVVPSDEATVSIEDLGVVVVAGREVLRLDPFHRPLPRRPAARPIGDGVSSGSPAAADGTIVRPQFDARELTLMSRDRDRELPLGLPNGTSWDVAPLGWVGGQALVQTVEFDDRGRSTGRIRLIDPARPSSSRVVAMIDRVASFPFTGFMSVATNLISPDRPTVDHPVPEWPGGGAWSAPPAWLATLAPAGLGLVLGTLVVRRRRRRLG